jgi:hypothetical protein
MASELVMGFDISSAINSLPSHMRRRQNSSPPAVRLMLAIWQDGARLSGL